MNITATGDRRKLGANSTQAKRAPKVSEKIAAAAKTTDHAARQAVAVKKHAPELVEPVKQGTMSLSQAAKVAQERKPRTPAPPPKAKLNLMGSDASGFSVDDVVRKLGGLLDVQLIRCPDEKRKEFTEKLVHLFIELFDSLLVTNGLLLIDRTVKKQAVLDVRVESLEELIREGLNSKQRAELRAKKW